MPTKGFNETLVIVNHTSNTDKKIKASEFLYNAIF